MNVYAALDARVTFTGDAGWVARLDDLYAACRVSTGGTARPVELGVHETDAGIDLARDGEVVLRAPSNAALVERVVWEINQLAWAAGGPRVLLHGAAVVVGSGAVVLCGPSGAGKSTLAAALVQRGAGYLTDEIVAFDPEAGVVVPYPKPISLRVADREPDVDGDRALLALRPEPGAPAVEPRAVVLVHHDGPGPTVVRDLARADALVALCEHAHELTARGATAFHALADLVTRSTCIDLGSGDLALACATLADHMHGSVPA